MELAQAEPSTGEESPENFTTEETVEAIDEGGQELETPDLTSMSLEELQAFKDEYLDKAKENSEKLQAEGEESNVEHEEPENAEAPQKTQSLKPESLDPQLQQIVETVNIRREGTRNILVDRMQTLNHLEEQAKEAELDNPREAARIDRDIEQIHREIEQISSDIEKLDRYENNIKTVAQYVKPEHIYEDEMVGSLVDDGLSPVKAQEYVKNMFVTETPTAIIALIRTGMYRKAFKNAVAQQQAKPQKVQPKKTLIKKPSSPDVVAEVLNKARTLPRTMSPAAASTSREPELSRNDLAELSLPELQKLYKERIKNG